MDKFIIKLTFCRSSYIFLAVLCWASACSPPTVRPSPSLSKGALAEHCRNTIGAPRIVQPVPGVWVALAYDLANTIVLETGKGIVVVDPSISQSRAMAIRSALGEVGKRPVAAIIYTHSHIDHVGGASVWATEGTEIWATDRFTEHFVKQYGMFQKAERRRGLRQFGLAVSAAELPCSGLGRSIPGDASTDNGTLLPDHTFSGTTTVTFGARTLQLIEAHGETDDQLMVLDASKKMLLTGDNFYHSFPNLYTIRGTRPRPVNEWIASLDKMRALDPELLIPSHTPPIVGREMIRTRLTSYRDAIQWVRDQVIRGANDDRTLNEIVTGAALPRHLAELPWLQQLYGQVDWSARALYTNELGWFDGQPEALYPLPETITASYEVDAMGGADAVLAKIQTAKDARWGLYLLTLLRHSGTIAAKTDTLLRASLLRRVADTVQNSNGRGYLLQMVAELEDRATPSPPPHPSEELLRAIPLEIFFTIMATRLQPSEAMDVFESVVFRFPPANTQFVLTVRYGVAELVAGTPLPGTPEPVAIVEVSPDGWRRLSLQIESPTAALLKGDLKIVKGKIAFMRFINRFDRSL